VPAPRPGRLWLEICGGILVLVAGFALGHGALPRHSVPVATPAAVLQERGKKAPATKASAQKPNWFASQDDDN
jgi:hypothetical protein